MSNPTGDSLVQIERLPDNWKCFRCYQLKAECAEWGNYSLCDRCRDFMHTEMNSFCVSCGDIDNAKDSLCSPCRMDRIKEYDKRLAKSQEISDNPLTN